MIPMKYKRSYTYMFGCTPCFLKQRYVYWNFFQRSHWKQSHGGICGSNVPKTKHGEKKGFIFSTKTLHIIPKRKYCLKRRQMWAGLVLRAADRLKVGWSVDVIGDNPEPSRDNTERESRPKKQWAVYNLKVSWSSWVTLNHSLFIWFIFR